MATIGVPSVGAGVATIGVPSVGAVAEVSGSSAELHRFLRGVSCAAYSTIYDSRVVVDALKMYDANSIYSIIHFQSAEMESTLPIPTAITY